MVEDNLKFLPEQKAAIMQLVLEEKKIPKFDTEVERVGYEDGCKVYFKNGDFISCRFSGTEPLLRIFAEASDEVTALKYISAFKSFLNI